MAQRLSKQATRSSVCRDSRPQRPMHSLSLLLLLSLLLALSFLLASDAASLRSSLAFRRLDDDGDERDRDDDGGDNDRDDAGAGAGDGDGDQNGAPTAVTPTGANCSFQFAGAALSFTKCVNLDASGKFLLAWSVKQGGALSVFFQGTPSTPYGWAGWGISPDGGHFSSTGSDNLIGYGDASSTDRTGGGLYHLQGRTATRLSSDSAGSLLTVASPGVKVEVADSGTTVRLLADISGVGNSGPVYVTFAGGPSADVSSGAITEHRTKGSVSIDLYSTASSNGSTGSTTAGSEGSTASEDEDDGNDAGSDGGSAAGGAVTSASSNCSAQFQGSAQNFSRCVNLDSSGKFALAWSPKAGSSAGIYTVLFQGSPESAYGWAGWGVSPTGRMDGSYDIVAFGDSNTASIAGAHVYKMNGLDATIVDSSSANGLLTVADVKAMQVEAVDSGNVIRVLADVSVPSGQADVIWAGGPSADASSGGLSVHRLATSGSMKIDFAQGSAVAAAGGSSHSEEKTIHAWLAGIGFGVLMPAGILVARHMKLWAGPLWYYLHIVIQVLGYLVGAVGFGYGVWLKNELESMALTSTQTAHYGIGIAMFCTSSLQILSPVAKPLKSQPSRLYWNLGHWILGYSTVIMGIVNIFLGFDIMASESLSVGAWRRVYIVVLCVWCVLLAVLEPISWYLYLREQDRAAKTGDHKPQRLQEERVALP